MCRRFRDGLFVLCVSSGGLVLFLLCPFLLFLLFVRDQRLFGWFWTMAAGLVGSVSKTRKGMVLLTRKGLVTNNVLDSSEVLCVCSKCLVI